jgi:hypothetical protein
MEAMKELGVDDPWDHVMIGDDRSWAMTLIKMKPFTEVERDRIEAYFAKHDTRLIYPVAGDPNSYEGATKYFGRFVESLKAGREDEFIDQYPFDISVVTDDKPFFYKQFKLTDFSPFEGSEDLDVGPVMFMTQLVILAQASLFILLFILLPLAVFRRQGIQFGGLSETSSCKQLLGLGFMLIEIRHQRFLSPGKPDPSISVTLVALLIATWTGSPLLPWLRSLDSP